MQNSTEMHQNETRGAHPYAPARAPRANVVAARGCQECRAWGTVVTIEGRLELCPACQVPG
ncbi:hypothetical protein OG871_33135 [Kitasatospora sp. NBC_00374]|uniref:hypothetical protein n=1 Tax=Kitasatospora sp. NBC_00374 TaxID=2975964 RepID=UPI0030E1BEC6